jgi:hypothetical protein
MDQYVNQLLKDQGVPDDLDPETRQQLVEGLMGHVANFINKRMIDAMDEATAEDFNRMLDDPNLSPTAVQNFMITRVPNREQVATDALLEFRQLYLGGDAQ